MRLVLLAIAALGFASPAFASGVKLESSVHEEITTVDAKGEKKISLVDPTAVAPGDVVVIRIAYHNTSEKPVGDIVISNPVPEHLSFLSVREGLGMVSVDGGKTYGALVELKVKDGDDMRAAVAADVTHVRWAFDQTLAAGAQGSVAFAARLD
ncbi:MAG: DUF11 domain-containing protein [Burkholderiales bacterium]|nr:MAG: DUF11 domain-containing protein [Burkholderiales bacterium]